MTFILKTEVNSAGNTVFSKVRYGKAFKYYAVADNGQTGMVTKTWVLANKNEILNLGVSASNIIYPVELKKKR